MRAPGSKLWPVPLPPQNKTRLEFKVTCLLELGGRHIMGRKIFCVLDVPIEFNLARHAPVYRTVDTPGSSTRVPIRDSHGTEVRAPGALILQQNAGLPQIPALP
jgi:hypothetical protein